ncbi:uncharacterized protein LOC122522373 [Polistes fuscatus]|uniref:uncharacterized protein LOC122522373 n=1 Tax=Polistes fuscatus TaxID=30207 RepID=UPI001CA82A57|nr:uncharacterized protein LOC122522373 [Polistes fuscatus]
MADHRPAPRSSRDIRLSTATMRALNSQRLQPRTSIFHSVARSYHFIFFILIFFLLHGVSSRSVSHDDIDNFEKITLESSAQKVDQVRLNTTSQEKLVGSVDRRENEKKLLEDKVKKMEKNLEKNETSVAKKRRRNDLTLPVKSAVQETDPSFITSHTEGDVTKNEGIRRFDAEVESVDEIELPSNDQSSKVNADQNNGLVKGERSQKKAIKVDDVKNNDDFILDTPVELINQKVEVSKVDDVKKDDDITLDSRLVEVPKVDADNILTIKEDIRNNLRSLVANEENVSEIDREKEQSPVIISESIESKRDQRYLEEARGKFKHKSSTVYLSAEEGSETPDSEEKSIVDSQIKKLISIRDDALGLVSDNVNNKQNIDEVKVLQPVKLLGIDDVIVTGDNVDDVRNQRSNFPNLPDTDSQYIIDYRLQILKDQAILLQEQIKNRTFVKYLKENEIDILPEMSRFNENQLLETLRNFVSKKKLTNLNQSYSNILNETDLTETQENIIKCAEQLIEVEQRQSFVNNMFECIRGFSVLNCLRIFVLPILVDNIPLAINEGFSSNLPIEINLFDLFQGNREKVDRSSSNVYQKRYLTPESVVLSILKQALESRIDVDKLPYFIDSKNETFQKLLTPGQLEILQLGEKLLPFDLRREYTDKMFSCVRRFEYLSCLRYFAWPMMRQYFPGLPLFPDYQTWYPSITIVPEYPIVPFPSFSDEVGELPEVVDSDATRMRKPTPETVIIHVLQNTLKDYHPRVESTSTPFEEPTNFYTTVIPPDQLITIQMAEEFIPISHRPEFVQKTVRCIQEYNYLTCMKYSTWPTVKQFIPQLPDFSSFFPGFSDFFSLLPSFPPTFSGLFGFIPGLPNITIPQQITQVVPIQQIPQIPTELPSSNTLYRKADDPHLNMESKIIETLEHVRNTLRSTNKIPSQTVSGNVIVLTTLTDKQFKILKLSESILPPSARATFLAQVLTCIQDRNDFINCTEHVIWPSITYYAPNLPEFSQIEIQNSSNEFSSSDSLTKNKEILQNSTENIQEPINSDALRKSTEKIMSRTSGQNEILSKTISQESNVPVISITGTRFVPIYTEHPESVILNILKKIQQSSANMVNASSKETTKTQLFYDILNAQQQLIIQITENLIPESARADFVDSMLKCINEYNFILCSRDILWPTLIDYFPGVPSFPNFGIFSNAPISGSPIPSLPSHNLTEDSSSAEASHLSETNVKTGQHGDATVTITDTRFVPIFTEHPEAIILNILEAVRISTPNLPRIESSMKKEDLSQYFTDRQSIIIQTAECLLPESERIAFIKKITICIQKNTFLECTKDITWPTVHQFFPRLPSFPEFGISQNIPRTKLHLSLNLDTPDIKSEADKADLVNEQTPIEYFEKKIENILEEILIKTSKPRLEHSYLDIDNPIIQTMFTKQQVDIIRLVEQGLPDPVRPTYVKKLLECMRTNNFIGCSQHVSWPTLKIYLSSLPNFPQFGDYFSQLPDISQLPGISSVPQLPGSLPLAEIPTLPLPQSIPSLPGGISQVSGVIPQIPETMGQFFGLPQFGNIPVAVKTIEYPKELLATVQQSSIKTFDSKKANQPLVPSSTPSFDFFLFADDQGIIPGYPGQPSGTLIDISTEKVNLSDKEQVESELSNKKVRKRRSVVDLFRSYPETIENEKEASEKSESPFPNIDESKFLQLLIQVSKLNNLTVDRYSSDEKEYFVDTLNSTIRDSLTADQYEILKKIEDLNAITSNRSFMTKVVQCIRSLSFIRCMGIFVWPVIYNNLPSLSSFSPFGRSIETEVEQFFGMSTSEFEKELLSRKESIENFLLDSYKKLAEEKFQTNWGFLKVKGYGNGEVSISFGGFREGRGTKIKDNKNLPSILTIISDIMEEVLDQRPDSDKNKKDKDKRDRSLKDNFQDIDYQFLKDNDDDKKTKDRSINDEEIISMFLDKIKSNISDNSESGSKNHLNLEDAYNAFEVLFGTRLNRKFMNRLKSFKIDHLRSLRRKTTDEFDKTIDIVPFESERNNSEDLKVIPLDARLNYDLEKESDDQMSRNRQDRTKNTLKSFVNKYSNSYLQKTKIEISDGNRLNDSDIENNIKQEDKVIEKDIRTKLMLQLPHLNEDIVPRKITNTVIELSRDMKLKIMQMMPGLGFVISFLIQMALAHARAAATMAGMLSNMALGSAMFAMIRQALFGPSTQPKIKYVYDNDKTEPGVVWPPKGYYAPYYG